MVNVIYRGGESRLNPMKAVDFMLAIIRRDGEEAELYAEYPVAATEIGSYESLKQVILKQAKSLGFNESELVFAYN